MTSAKDLLHNEAYTREYSYLKLLKFTFYRMSSFMQNAAAPSPMQAAINYLGKVTLHIALAQASIDL